MPRHKPLPKFWPSYVTKELHEYCLKEMPKGAIKADLTKHAPHNSYSPPMWYVDEHRKCTCGVEFTFTARQQQHWFEVLKIPIYVEVFECSKCRAKRRREIAAQKKHMTEMASRQPHPNEAFFQKKRSK